MRRLVPLVLLLAACGLDGAVETTTTVPVAATSTTSTTVATTEAQGPVVLAEVVGTPDLSVRTRLQAGVRYRLDMDSAGVEISPPSDGWDVLYYRRDGVLFGWRGPSGFKAETMDVVVKVFFEGEDAAWSAVEAIGEAGLKTVGEPWTLVEDGTARVGGSEAGWREYGTPGFDSDVPAVGPTETDFSFAFSLIGAGVGRLLLNTSARFYVLPLGDQAVMVMAFETRCACYPNPRTDYDRGSQIADDTENELRDWLPELEAFLARMEFVES